MNDQWVKIEQIEIKRSEQDNCKKLFIAFRYRNDLWLASLKQVYRADRARYVFPLECVL